MPDDDEPYDDPERDSIEVWIRAFRDGSVRMNVDSADPFSLVMSADQAEAIAADLAAKARAARHHTEAH